MRKKFFALAIGAASLLALVGCGKDSGIPKKKILQDRGNYSCYQTTEKPKDENGKKYRTYYFTNDNESFELEFNVINNFELTDFTNGVALITNDSYGHDRYQVIDTAGNDIIPYDTYTYMEKPDGVAAFIVSTDTKEDKLYGVVNEKKEELVPSKYTSIVKFPTDKKFFFLCNSSDNIYDIYNESGKLVLKDMVIENTEEMGYTKSTLGDEDNGIFGFKVENAWTLASEHSGKIIIATADYFSDSIIDYIIPGPYHPEKSISIVSDNGDEVHVLSEDFSGCSVFAIKGRRFIIDSDSNILAEYTDKGKKASASSTGMKITPVTYEDNRYYFVENDSKFEYKSSNGQTLRSFTKDSNSLYRIDSFGFTVMNNETLTLYALDGSVVFDNLQDIFTYTRPDEFTVKNIETTIYPVYTNENVIFEAQKEPIVAIHNKTDDLVCLREATTNIGSYKYSDIKDIDDRYGYILFYMNNGNIYNKSGNLIYGSEEATEAETN